MAAIPQPKRPPLTAADKTALVGKDALLRLMEADGITLETNGDGYRCAIRDERTPSCHLYPPKADGRGWTFHDFGTDAGGDAFAYLMHSRGLDFIGAAAVLADLNGYTPDALWEGAGIAQRTSRLAQPNPRHHQTPTNPDKMPLDEQKRACDLFLSTLLAINPDAAPEGAAYLARRGVLMPDWPPLAYRLPSIFMSTLLKRLIAHPEADLITRAGLMKPPDAEAGKGAALAWGEWAGDVILLAHLDKDGAELAFIARRTSYAPGDYAGKYLQQTYDRGATRFPFNLPTLYRPRWLPWKPHPDKADKLLIVEGTLDALGAALLGWPALAFSMRPQARHYADRTGACPRMLAPHLPALRDLRRVYVMPDNDPGEKGATGADMAAHLVGWLRAEGCRADVALMATLYPDAPADCKDLADLAATMKENKP